MQSSQLRCSERNVLESRYRADLCVYVEAVTRLKDVAPNPLGEFETLFDDLERARLVFERARETLNSHLEKHNCGEG
jgi:hypothetical protein